MTTIPFMANSTTLKGTHLDYNAFGLDLSKSAIVWAPNGTGKSTTTGAILRRFPNKVLIANYESCKTDVIRGRKQLSIGCGIASIKEKETMLEECIRSFRSKGLFTFAANKSIWHRHTYVNQHGHPDQKWRDLSSVDQSALQQLIDCIREDEWDFFIGNWESLKNYSVSGADAEKWALAVVDSTLEKLSNVSSSLDQSCCPICLNPLGEMSLSSVLTRDVFSDECPRDVNPAIETYCSEIDSDLKTAFDRVSFLSKITIDLDITYLDVVAFRFATWLGSDSADFKKKAKQISGLMRDINKAKVELQESYERLRRQKERISNLFSTRFDARVSFDDKRKQLVITLPRNASEYSTGEIDLMVIATKICEFDAGDFNCFVIDDPLSSYDMANQYWVLGQISELAESYRSDGTKKSIVVFTHNMNCMNITKFYNFQLFSYYVMERIGNRVFLNEIESSVLPISPQSLKNHPRCDKGIWNIYLDYVDAIWVNEEERKTVASVFHYDEPTQLSLSFSEEDGHVRSALLSNDVLSSFVINLKIKDIVSCSFSDYCLFKVLLILSLRVWVEKQFYEANEADVRNLMGLYPKNCELGKKINYLFDPLASGEIRWKGSSKVTKEFLVNKKTMLNNVAHPGSSMIPFEFAICLSLNDIQNEIDEIVEAFEG